MLKRLINILIDRLLDRKVIIEVSNDEPCDGLIEYVVLYTEFDRSLGRFLCWAEDAEHAIEQTRNAYPDLISIDQVVFKQLTLLGVSK